VVYTWVNGSDPVWMKKKEEWVKRMQKAEEDKLLLALNTTEMMLNSTTIDPTLDNSTAINATTPETPKEEDDTMSANRYRDSEELRYSLRSLLKNAPWIRHIYLVTDNQIPYWLNIDTDRLSVVTHEEIFANKSHLPVFSSPAIEANLHRIPGLSKKFIYFNDDVMLGTTVVPDDFVTLSGSQKFYMAWDVPKCAPGCSDSWIGDGFCDKACNVSACNFDWPDCMNGTNVAGGSSYPSGSGGSGGGYSGNARPVVTCAKGCPDGWLADKICDQRCKNPECGYDVGDCGLNLVIENYEGVQLSSENSYFPSDMTLGSSLDYYAPFEDFPSGLLEVSGEPFNETNLTGNDTWTSGSSLQEEEEEEAAGLLQPLSSLSSSSSSSDRRYMDPGEVFLSDHIAMEVPYGTFGVYFNLSILPCRFFLGPESYLNKTGCQEFLTTLPPFLNNNNDFKYSVVEFNEDEKLIVHSATVVSRHNLLMVLLYYGQEAEVPKLTEFPYYVDFTVTGSDTNSNAQSLLFRIKIVERTDERKALESFLPNDNSLILLEERPLVSLHISDHLKKKNIVMPTIGENETTIGNNDNIFLEELHLLPIPFSSNHSRYQIKHPTKTTHHQDTVIREEQTMEGILVDMDVSSHYLFLKEDKLKNSILYQNHSLFSKILVTLKNETSYLTLIPLCHLIPHFTNVQSTDNDPSSSNTIEERFEMSSFHHRRLNLCDLDVVQFWRHTTRNYRKYEQSKLKELIPGFTNKYWVPANQQQKIVKKEGRKEAHHDNENDDSSSAFSSKVVAFLPVPMKMKEFEKDWISVKMELFLTNHIINDALDYNPVQWEEFSPSHSFQYEGVNPLKGKEQERILSANLLFMWGMNHTTTRAVTSSSELPATVETNTTTNTEIIYSELAHNDTVQAQDSIIGLNDNNNSTLELNNNNNDQSADHSAASTPMNTIVAGGEAFDPNDLMIRRKLVSSPLSNKSLARESALSVVKDLFKSFSAMISSLFNFSSQNSLPTKQRSKRRRRLTDTYGASLIHVNRLYNKEFGVEARKVPAHVPHMIDREIMDEMQKRWPSHWNDTSSHRFRSQKDMQYSFSYYYYTMNRHKLSTINAKEFIKKMVDHDRDELISPNEFRTLVTLLKGKTVSEADLTEYSDCVKNASSSRSDGNSDLFHFEDTVQHPLKIGMLQKSVSFLRYPSIEEVLNCSLITMALRENKDFVKRFYSAPIVGNDKDIVAFEMINDNLTDTVSQLDSIRQRQPKFICVNDNMKSPSKELEIALKDFYLSLFPKSSMFELPEGKRNPFLHVTEYNEWKKEQMSFPFGLLNEIRSFFAETKKSFNRKTREILWKWIDHLEESSSSSSDQENQQEIIVKRLRNDLRKNPVNDINLRHHQHLKEGSRFGLNHFHLFLSVIGLVLLIFLRNALSRFRSVPSQRTVNTRRNTSNPPPDSDDDDDSDNDDNNDSHRRSNSNNNNNQQSRLQLQQHQPRPRPVITTIGDFGGEDENNEEDEEVIRHSSKFAQLIAAEASEAEVAENKLYAVNDIPADEYAFLLRMAAQDEINEVSYYQDHPDEEEAEEHDDDDDQDKKNRSTNSQQRHRTESSELTAQDKKRKKRNRKKKVI
jgi:hypothetical protein